MMICVPSIHKDGEDAAHAGSRMATLAQPMGYVFCPYARGSVEHFNFISGVVQVVFEGDDIKRDVVHV